MNKFHLFIDTFLLKFPFIKTIILSKELGRFSYLLNVLVNSGVNYVKAIRLAVNTLSNEELKMKFNKAIEFMLKGNKFSASLLKSGFNYDKSFIQALALAEETSQISEVLKNISTIYIENNQNRINLFLSLLEPVLILIIGSIIGFIVTALLLPLLNMNILN